MPQRKVTVKQMKRDPFREALLKVKDALSGKEAVFKQTGVAIAAVVIAGMSLYYFLSYRRSSAEAAYAAAYEVYTAPVGETNANHAPVFFSSEEDKYRKAAEAFKRCADKYSAYRDISHYMAASCYLRTEPDKARPILESLSQRDSQIGRLASFSLANFYRTSRDYEKAIALLKKLASRPVDLPEPDIKFELGQALLAAGRADEAASTFFEVASADRSSQVGQKALEILGDINPDKALQVPSATPKL